MLAVRSVQLVTVMFSVRTFSPKAGDDFRQMASFTDSMKQLAIRTFWQQSGSMPSLYELAIVTPSISTSRQPSRLMA